MTLNLNEEAFWAIVLVAYGLYLAWCRWLEYRGRTR